MYEFNYDKPIEAGKLIGIGKSRHVYEYLPDTNYVLKIDMFGGLYNKREINTYIMFKYFGYDHILCPCRTHATFHLMEKASQVFLSPSYEISIFSPKPKNWGILNGNICRLDYTWDTVNENGNWYVKFLKTDLKKYLNRLPWLSNFTEDRGDLNNYHIHCNEESFRLMYDSLKTVLVI